MEFENNIGRFTGRLYYLMGRHLNRQLQQAGTDITADQFRFLTHLWKKDGITQQQVAMAVSRDRASITRMVDVLEKQGIITRIADKNDRRVNLIYLTKKGKELQSLAAEAAKQVLNQTVKGFTKTEQAAFSGFLQKSIKNLEP
jgi:DNA-binding MarR family transcriptional regulator